MTRVTAAVLTCLASLWGNPSPAGEPQRWLAGAYSFSDELGGFRIVGISGSGTKADPIVIRQELLSASPVTLVIRTTMPLVPFASNNPITTGQFHIRLVTLNNSGLAWMEFEFELQEIRGRPSTHDDGLSFDQRRVSAENRMADLFRIHNTDFEPFDRLVFTGGKVDPLETATFGFLVTDFTPTAEFYLKQDPRIPMS